MDLNIMQLKQARENFLRKTMRMDDAAIQSNMKVYEEKLKGGKGNYVLAYAVCFIDGLEKPIWTSVTKDVLEKIKSLSQSANSQYSPYNSGVDVHNSMQFKAAIKKLFKFLPKQALQEVAKAIEVDDKMMAGSVAIMTEDGQVEIIEDITDTMRDKIERLMDTSSYEEKAKNIIRFKMNNGMTKAEAEQLITDLQDAQVINNPSATDAKKSVQATIM